MPALYDRRRIARRSARSGVHAEHLRAGLQPAAGASRLPRTARAARLGARDASTSARASGRSSPARPPIRTTTTWPRKSCSSSCSGARASARDGEWRELEPGDVLSFPRGREGGHQVANWGEVTGPLPRRLDERDARPRRLPGLGQARRLRAPAGPRRPVRGLPHGRRRRVPRRRAAARCRPAEPQIAPHVAEGRLDYRRAMRRVDVIAIALAVVAGAFGVSAGTGPLMRGLAALVLAGLALRARSAAVHRRLGGRAAAGLGHLAGPLR